MHKPPLIRLAASLIASVAFVSGGPVNAADPQSAPSPTLRVGDRWVYNVTSGVGLTKTTYQETREVTAVDANGIKVKVTGKASDGKDFTRIDDLASPGEVRYGAPCFDEAYRFQTPLQRVTFPIVPGERSAKWVDVIAEPSGTKGQFNYYFHTLNWDKQTVPAGSFDAIRVDVLMMLDDATAKALIASNVFRRVVPFGAAADDGDYVLDGFVSELYADTRDAAAPAAVITITYYLTPTSTIGSGVAWSHEYRKSVKVSGTGPEAVARGWNAGLSAVLADLTRDLAAAELAKP